MGLGAGFTKRLRRRDYQSSCSYIVERGAASVVHRAVTSPTEGLKYTVENRQPDFFNIVSGGMELPEWEFAVFDLG